MREQSWAEQRAQNRPVNSTQPRAAPRQWMSPGRREHNLSEKHIAMLRANTERMRLAGQYPSIRGTVKGWGGTARKAELKRHRAAARLKAQTIMDKLIKDGIVDKEGAGNAALAFAIEVVVTTDADNKAIYSMSDRLKAASLALTYTMAKPETKTVVKVETAEDWLNKLATDETAAE